MKKLFLFVAALTLSLTSCSSDDNNGGGEGQIGNSELKVTIDGVQKTFNTIDVNEIEGDNDYGELNITASIDNNPSEIIRFTVQKAVTGSNVLYGFVYVKNGKEYDPHYGENSFLTSIVQTNSNDKLKGTFIGKLGHFYYDSNGNFLTEEIELTDGSFDISY